MASQARLEGRMVTAAMGAYAPMAFLNVAMAAGLDGASRLSALAMGGKCWCDKRWCDKCWCDKCRCDKT
jgi:hypothetical protein